MKSGFILGIVIIAVFLTACAPTPYLYYGDTAQNYYRSVKKQDDTSKEKYKASLEKVFNTSARLGKPVPPGLYCDYALLLLEENNTTEAEEYFKKEKSTWVESTPFIDFMILRYSPKTGGTSNEN